MNPGGGAALRAAASSGDATACARILGFGDGGNTAAAAVRFVRFSRDELGRSALHLAASAGHAAVVRLLLAAASHKEIDSADGAGCTPLQRAAADGHEDVVRLLLAKGADINRQDNVHGNSALHEAAWKGYSRTIKILAEASANLHNCNAGGFTALHLCCQNGHNQACRELLLAGCDPDLPNNYGDTALHTAARYGHAGVTRILISAQCRVSEQNKNGDTALHIATAMGRRKLTRILLEAGCEKDTKNKQNETAKDIAVRKELDEMLAILDETPAGKRSGAKKRSSKNKSKKSNGGNKSPGKAQWSPYGCHYYPDPEAFPSPRLDSLPQEPLKRGEQYYLDLAGNIRKGPVGVGYTCYCAPLFRHLEAKLEKEKRELQKAQLKLGQRVAGLEQKLIRGVRGRRSERAAIAAKEVDVSTLTRSKSLEVLDAPTVSHSKKTHIQAAKSMDALEPSHRKSVKELIAKIQRQEQKKQEEENQQQHSESSDEEEIRLKPVKGPMGDTNLISPSYENIHIEAPRSRSAVYSPELQYVEPIVKVKEHHHHNKVEMPDPNRPGSGLRPLLDRKKPDLGGGDSTASSRHMDSAKMFESTTRMLENPLVIDRDNNNDSGYSTKIYGSSKGNSPNCQVGHLGASSLV